MRRLAVLGLALLLALALLATALVAESAPKVAVIEVKGMVCQA